MHLSKALFYALICFFVSSAALAYEARVIKIADGDTLTVLRGREQIKVRLAEIDAPEKKQPFGTRARQSLADLCFGQVAEVMVDTTDRYGRSIARVKCQGQDASYHQIEAGLAWVYFKYSKNPRLMQSEGQARVARRGLWADKEPVPPWEWRKNRH